MAQLLIDSNFILIPNPPVWNTVRHTPAHISAVVTTITFAEKRAAFTKYAIRAIEYNISTSEPQENAELIETIRAAMVNLRVAVPYWGRGGRVTAAVDEALTVTTQWPFAVDDPVIVYGAPGESVLRTIDAIAGDQYTLDSDPELASPRAVVPILKGTLDDIVDAPARTGRSGTYRIKFREAFAAEEEPVWVEANKG